LHPFISRLRHYGLQKGYSRVEDSERIIKAFKIKQASLRLQGGFITPLPAVLRPADTQFASVLQLLVIDYGFFDVDILAANVCGAAGDALAAWLHHLCILSSTWTQQGVSYMPKTARFFAKGYPLDFWPISSKIPDPSSPIIARDRSSRSMEATGLAVAPDGWLATALKCEHCSHFAAHRDSTLYPGLREPASEGRTDQNAAKLAVEASRR